MSGSIYVSRLILVSANPEQLARFYVDALDFVMQPAEDGRNAVHLRLGDQEIEIEAFDPPGELYPPGVSGLDTLFQHFAIVVTDMDKAYDKLRPHPLWMPISLLGPERLPDSSGGVSAFKFRDPEGHPLELISFTDNRKPQVWDTPPEGSLFLGIDHSAISISNTEQSIAFYRSLGLAYGGGSFNEGSAQVRLDAIENVTVEVTSLVLSESTAPHVELLCYRAPPGEDLPARSGGAQPNDIAATRLVFTLPDAEMLSAFCTMHEDKLVLRPISGEGGIIHALLRDPDGHLIQLEVIENTL